MCCRVSSSLDTTFEQISLYFSFFLTDFCTTLEPQTRVNSIALAISMQTGACPGLLRRQDHHLEAMAKKLSGTPCFPLAFTCYQTFLFFFFPIVLTSKNSLTYLRRPDFRTFFYIPEIIFLARSRQICKQTKWRSHQRHFEYCSKPMVSLKLFKSVRNIDQRLFCLSTT